MFEQRAATREHIITNQQKHQLGELAIDPTPLVIGRWGNGLPYWNVGGRFLRTRVHEGGPIANAETRRIFQLSYSYVHIDAQIRMLDPALFGTCYSAQSLMKYVLGSCLPRPKAA